MAERTDNRPGFPNISAPRADTRRHNLSKVPGVSKPDTSPIRGNTPAEKTAAGQALLIGRLRYGRDTRPGPPSASEVVPGVSYCLYFFGTGCNTRSASAAPAGAPTGAKGRPKIFQPRSRGLRISSKKPVVHNESLRQKAKREGTNKRTREHRERSAPVGTYLYTDRVLTWLLTHRRPRTGHLYLTEREASLGESERRADVRGFDLALRRAVTDVLDDLAKGRIRIL